MKPARLQQPHVLGEEGEEAADEEGGDQLRRVAGVLQRHGQAGEAAGDVPGDAGGAAGGVEAQGVEPDRAQLALDRADRAGPRGGCGGSGGPGRGCRRRRCGELAEELDAAADVDHDDEGRAALGGGQGAGVLHGLAVGAQHGLVPGGVIGAETGLLGLQHVAGAAVEVDEAVAAGAVAVLEDHPALEAVGVLVGVLPGRVRLGQVEEGAEFGEEELVVGPLGAVGPLPAGDEGVHGF